MASNFDFLDELEKDITLKEKICTKVEDINKLINAKENAVMYLNIRSINCNFNQLQILISRLEFKPFVIVCVETWHVEHANFYQLPGYHMYYNEGDLNIADRVIVYVLNEIGHETEIIEIGKLKAINVSILMNNDRTFEISSVYRSHEIPKAAFISALKKLIEIKKEIKNHFIVGDFNINLLEDDVFSQVLLETVTGGGYIPGFYQITRPSNKSKNKGSCIDNVFIKTESLETRTFTLQNSLSDHYTLFFNIKKQLKISSVPDNSFLDYNKLKSAAMLTNWSEIENLSDVNLATDLFIEKIQNCIEQAKTKKKTRFKKRKAWISESIIKLCEIKDNLYKIWKDDLQNLEKKRNFTNFANKLKITIDQAKRNMKMTLF